MDHFRNDVRYAARLLLKHAGASAVMVLTLGLAIGAATAVFSVVHGVLLQPLPYPQADRIVSVAEVGEDGSESNLCDPNFADLHEANHSFAGFAQYVGFVESIAGGSEPVRAQTALVSKDFFDVMGARPLLGRPFAPEEQRVGAPRVALVSHAFWRRFLNESQDLSQTRLRIAGGEYAVVGVMPAGFRFPDATDVWAPREQEETLPSRSAHNWQGVARLRDGVTLAAARADLTSIGRRLKQQYGSDIWMAGVALMPLQQSLTSAVRPALLLLMG